MCARNVSVHLKPNTLSDFRKTFETNVLPILRKQKGFQDEITFSTNGGLDVIAISLWDTKEHAETYNTTGYPEVLNVGGGFSSTSIVGTYGKSQCPYCAHWRMR